MSERGLIGVGVLWLIVAATTLAYAALALGRWHKASGQNQLQDVKMIFMAEAALLMERESGFRLSSADHEFQGGRVHLDRTLEASSKEARVVCAVRSGQNEKRVETRWVRMGDEWRAVSWREM